MPTYSYRCTECGTAFDIQQAFTDDSLTECTQVVEGRACRGRLRKLFSAVGVSFNGSGFYRTDSRASETTAREKKESAPAADSKPAASSSDSSSPKPAAASSTPAPAKSAAPASKE